MGLSPSKLYSHFLIHTYKLSSLQYSSQHTNPIPHFGDSEQPFQCEAVHLCLCHGTLGG